MHMECQSVPTNTSIATKVASYDNFESNEKSFFFWSWRCGKNVSQVVNE
jgi:hypothetical protein